MANLKPCPQVDLLLGVDGNIDAGSGVQPEVKVKNPDILEFVDIPEDLPDIKDEAQNMDVTDGLSCDSLSDGWSLVKEASPESPVGGLRSPDIVVTSSASHLDKFTDEDPIKEHVEEKTDENVKEKDVERTDNIKDGTSNQDFDFSVLELPESSNLNFDHFKHKRNISQKGSIANRKKPKRSTIQNSSEDSFFLDSTEPKPQKQETEEDKEDGPSPDHNQEEMPQEPESEASAEISPSRKLAGGIKIPGLLEGLSKSKAFNKFGKTSPETEPDIVPQLVSPEKDKSPTAPQATISTNTVTLESPQFISPKPVVLPRVLPKPTNKTLKETQNQTTAGSNIVRASSFKINNQSPGSVEPPSYLKSSTSLSRSSSVKVPGALINKDLDQTPLKEQSKPSFGLSKFSSPTLPEIKSPLSSTTLKSPIKTPPPVASKPLVAAKPGRTNLKLSASFTGGRSPMLSESRTKTTGIPTTISDPGLVLNGSSKTEPITISPELRPKSGTTTSSMHNSPASYSSSSTRKSYSFGQKTIEVHSSVTPDRTNLTTENKKPSLEEIESTKKEVSLTSVPSLRKPLQSGPVASSGAKPNGTSTNVEMKKIEDPDTDDVFDTSSDATDKSVASIKNQDSITPSEKHEYTNAVEEIVHQRRSSITGVMSVKSPLSGDKPLSGLMPRKGSITGSAYNPIGFRSTLGSSDSEQRSRGSSFSSTADVVASVDSMSSMPVLSYKPKDDPFESLEDQRSRDGSINGTVSDRVSSTPEKSLKSDTGKPEVKPALLAKSKYTASLQRKAVDETKNEIVSEVKTDVQGSKYTSSFQRKTVDDTKMEVAREVKTDVQGSKITPSFKRHTVDETKVEVASEVKTDVQGSKITPSFKRHTVDETKVEVASEVKTDVKGLKITPSFKRQTVDETKIEVASEVMTDVKGLKITPSFKRQTVDETKVEVASEGKTDVQGSKITPSFKRKTVDETNIEVASEVKTDVQGSKYTPSFKRKTVDETKIEVASEVKTDVQGSKITPSFQRKTIDETKVEVASEVKTDVQGSKITPSFQRKTVDETKVEVASEVKTDVQGSKITPSFQRKTVDDTKKETDVPEPLRTLRESKSPFSRNGSPEITKGGVVPDRKSSPWNVQLKKVEKKEPVKPEAVIKTEDPQPVNWRQQLSMRSRNPPAITADVEKPKQDTTPEWAKASIKRRQRLIESGVIRSDS